MNFLVRKSLMLYSSSIVALTGLIVPSTNAYDVNQNQKNVATSITIGGSNNFNYEIAQNVNAALGLMEFTRRTTVKVYGPGAIGSGILIHRDKDKYYILTAKHVVSGVQIREVVPITASTQKNTTQTWNMQIRTLMLHYLL